MVSEYAHFGLEEACLLPNELLGASCADGAGCFVQCHWFGDCKAPCEEVLVLGALHRRHSRSQSESLAPSYRYMQNNIEGVILADCSREALQWSCVPCLGGTLNPTDRRCPCLLEFCMLL